MQSTFFDAIILLSYPVVYEGLHFTFYVSVSLFILA